ncbi:hypothetical protein [Vibrio phage 29Fa.3]|nr:hypothetical protein [Vibrio phage 29Fa.3]WKC56075.1 hypothetical protein [Vibrio phage CAU_VPP01]
MQKVTSYTINLIPTIYDLSRIMSADRIMVVTRVPSLENDLVTRANLPSLSQDPIELEHDSFAYGFASTVKALNVDAFFTKLKDLAKRHYSLSDTGEFIEDLITDWHCLCDGVDGLTVGDVGYNLIKTLKSHGVIRGQVIRDTDVIDQDPIDAVNYASYINAHLNDGLILLRGHHRNNVSMLQVSDALRSGNPVAFHIVDNQRPEFRDMDVTTTGFFEALAVINPDEFHEAMRSGFNANI